MHADSPKSCVPGSIDALIPEFVRASSLLSSPSSLTTMDPEGADSGTSPAMVESGLAVPEDDPQSELNVLRREVRQLQASVRDSALQIASQQDELAELRRALAAAEVEVEEGLVREGNLRMQLDVQCLKRQQIESTMTAAEALVSSLREMIREGENGNGDPAGEFEPVTTESYPDNPYTSRKESGSLVTIEQSKLDRILSSIEDNGGDEKLEDEQQNETVHTEASSIGKADSIGGVSSDAPPAAVEQEEDASPGDTVQQPNPALHVERRRVLSHNPVRTPSHPGVSSPNANTQKRHSVPRASPSAAPPTPPEPVQKPNLLMSAFRPTQSVVDAPTSSIHSSSVTSSTPLPTEVVLIAKSAGAPSPREALPASISRAISDAHSGEVYALASSADCEWTVSGGDDKTVKVYDNTGRPYATIAENTRSVTALGIHPESGNQQSEAVLIYSGGSDGSVRAFRRHQRRRSKWALTTVLPVHAQAVRSILVTDKAGLGGSSNLILTCSTDRTIRMCDVEHSRRPFSVTSPSAVLDVASFGAAASGLIVSAHKDGGLRLWSGRDGNAMIGGAKIHSKGIVSVCCFSDGQSVLTLGRDNAMRLSDIRMNIGVVREMEGGVQTVSDWHRAAVNGRHVACGLGRPGHLGVWNVDTGKLVRRVSTQSSDPDVDVLDMVARKLRSPSCVVVPLWTASGHFVCGHRTRQVSFWNCT